MWLSGAKDIWKVTANISKSGRIICRDVVQVAVGKLMAPIHHWLNREHGGTPDYHINNPAWVRRMILGSYIQLEQLPKQEKHPVSNSKQQLMLKVSHRLEITDAAGSMVGLFRSGPVFIWQMTAELKSVKWHELSHEQSRFYVQED